MSFPFGGLHDLKARPGNAGVSKNGKAHSSALLFSVYPVIVTARGRGHVFFFKCQQTGYKDIR